MKKTGKRRARGKRTPWRIGGHTRELGHSEPGTKLSSSLGQEGFGYKFIYLFICIFMTQSHTVAQTGLELTM